MKDAPAGGRFRPFLLALAFLALAALFFDALSGTLSLLPDGWLKAAVLVASGPGLVLLAPLLLLTGYRFRARAVSGIGTVETCEHDSLREAGYELTVRFTTPDGVRRSFTATTGRRRRIGERVPILYDAGDPEDAKLRTHPATEVAGALVVLVMGVASCLLIWIHYLNG